MSMGRTVPTGFVTAYGPKLVLGVDAHASEENGMGAIQAYKDECDINCIMSKNFETGALSWLNAMQGTYEDVTGCDFQTCMDQVVRAQEAFDALPSKLRDRFANDPQRFLDFVHDPSNAQEMITLGLRNPPPAAAESAPVAVPSVPAG